MQYSRAKSVLVQLAWGGLTRYGRIEWSRIARRGKRSDGVERSTGPRAPEVELGIEAHMSICEV
jgi:hypothetical protein